MQLRQNTWTKRKKVTQDLGIGESNVKACNISLLTDIQRLEAQIIQLQASATSSAALLKNAYHVRLGYLEEVRQVLKNDALYKEKRSAARKAADERNANAEFAVLRTIHVDPIYAGIFKDLYGVAYTEFGNSAADCGVVIALEERLGELRPADEVPGSQRRLARFVGRQLKAFGEKERRSPKQNQLFGALVNWLRTLVEDIDKLEKDSEVASD